MNYCIDCSDDSIKEIHDESTRCVTCANRLIVRDQDMLNKRGEKIRQKLLGNKNGCGKRSPLSDKHKESIRRTLTGRKFGSRSKQAKENIRLGALKRIQNIFGPYKDTKPELKMKELLSRLGINFKHQVRVKWILHIYDFRAIGTKILIEVDGKYWHKRGSQRQKDYKFNRLAKKLGYEVLRFWDTDIMNNEEKVIKKLKVSLHV